MIEHHTPAWYRTTYLLKYPATFAFGVTVTLILLYLMQYLIDTGEKALDETPNMQIAEFVRLKEELQVRMKQRRPEPPPAPDEPPPEMRQQSEVVNIDNAWNSDFRAPLAQIDISRSASFSSDGEYLPILKVQPVYPRYALQKGQFGWVLLEFTVNEAGKVINPIVIDNCVENFKPGRFECIDRPGRVFDRPALAAARKFKYKPRVVDGVPIETQGVIHKITFELDEMQRL